MTWHRKYWDTIDQLYWDPSLLGLASIPKSEWVIDDQYISIPKTRVQRSGSVYARKGTAVENGERMRRLEEPLNHIFDIAFGIAASPIIESLLLRPFGWEDSGEFVSLGREIASRYDGFANSNTTQQDGYFVSTRTLLGVELKIDSRTWSGQVLKYLALMVAEEKLSGRRDQLGLLFITPDSSHESVFRDGGISEDGKLSQAFLQGVPDSKINRMIANMLSTDFDHFSDLSGRVSCAHISWMKFADTVFALAAQQDGSVGGKTTERLLEGLGLAIREQLGAIPAA